jgi:2-polyprenyl-6-methoxyphenol hydroxylase-like FAD-dependent oxidoreductase
MTRTSRLSVAVLGGGIAGLATALTLARSGHAITLVERDAMDVNDALGSLDWERKGIPHFLQPHAFTPRGRKELRETLPDVFDALMAAGAWDVDLRPKIRGGEPRRDDDELVFLAVRRPLIEWALRRAAVAQPGTRILAATKAIGLIATSGQVGAGPPRIRGVRTTAGPIEADLVIDAMGRGSPMADWIRAVGGRAGEQRSSDCSIIYYCRYYRVRDGQTLPDLPSIPGPRGDLGYAAFSTFPGDNRTFCALIAIPPGDLALKAVRSTRAFEAAVRTMPALNAWTNADTSEPITGVMPMGSLRNTLQASSLDGSAAIGLIGVGDAVCHTDPVASLGLAFALSHARRLADALRDNDDLVEAAHAFDVAARPEMEERYAYVSAIDQTRTRLWAGESIDYTHASGGAYPFFTYAATGVAPLAHGDVFRAVVRRNTFLDPLAVLDENPEMQAQLEGFYADLAAAGRPRSGPSRGELLEIITDAAAQGR